MSARGVWPLPLWIAHRGAGKLAGMADEGSRA